MFSACVCVAFGCIISVSALPPSCDDIKSNLGQINVTVRDCITKFGHTYWRIENLLDRKTAQRACDNAAGNLVSIADFNEKMLVNNLCQNNLKDYGDAWQQGCWIGLYRKEFDCKNDFVWADYSEFNYVDFLTGEPNCGDNVETCVQHVTTVIKTHDQNPVNIGWNDIRCSATLKSICKSWN